MLEKAGIKGTEKDGVFFSEENISAHPVICHVSAEISRQNANLTMIKQQLAKKAHSAQGNAIINFKYGQKSHKWWQLMSFRWDTESWHGEGDVVKL